MKVRDTFKTPKAADYSEFTKEVVKVGEAIEALGYDLEDENYSQGEQGLGYRKGKFVVSVTIEEED